MRTGIAGWERIELARLYGCLRVISVNLQWRTQHLTEENRRELQDIRAALEKLGRDTGR